MEEVLSLYYFTLFIIDRIDNQLHIVSLNRWNLPDISTSTLKTNCVYNLNQESQTLQFSFKWFKYIYDSNKNIFKAFEFDINENQDQIIENWTNGWTDTEVAHQKILFGICDWFVTIPSVFLLIVTEFSDPFYIFQLFSVILWYCNVYEYYASIIVVATIVSLTTSVIETRTSLVCIQQMARYSCKVNVYRKDKDGQKQTKEISSLDLIPGDLFEIPEDGYALPCDCLWINGTVIINESMWTGESTPIIKSHMPAVPIKFNSKEDSKYVLFAGTKIVQKRAHGNQKVLGLVYKTGFDTVKGNLIRSILFPKEVEQKFKADSLKYILVMAILCWIGFFISLPFLLKNADWASDEIGIKFLDLITTTVPPALPTCLGVGVTYAWSRLKNGKIICINRERVNIVGKIDMICFDKTGTLTEDHLDITSYRPITLENGKFVFDHAQKSTDSYAGDCFDHYKNKIKNKIKNKANDLKQLFIECLATCHGITTVKGKMIGDPIDVKMFQATGWVLKENVENKNNYDSLVLAYVRPKTESDINEKLSDDQNENEENILREHYELGIIRRFDFSSKLQRMTTLVKDPNDKFFKAFCKGSPEKIKELCKPETVPENFNEIWEEYTTKGFRVLALSTKFVKMDFTQAQQVAQEFVEKNMIFLGLLIVQNKLKKATKDAIRALDQAHLKMLMATGDNIWTAISVSKECEWIPPFSTIYSCELVKDNEGNHNLQWNTVEKYEGKQRNSSQIQNNQSDVVLNVNVVTEVNQTINLMNINSRLNEKTKANENSRIEEHFPPESFSTDIKVTRLNSDNNEDDNIIDAHDKSRIDCSEIVNIEDGNKPFQDNDDFIIAITGNTFEQLFKKKKKYLETKDEKYKLHYDTFRLVLQHGYIFARMAPEHKTLLVENLREENFNVMMCGDGANDCGAWRAADVGVSLSPEEASIAAHFTSKVPDISCLITLLREGKASWVTSIQTFKYMMMYSFTQFFSVTLLLIYRSYLSDAQFLVSDVFIIFPLAFFIAQTGSYEKLTHDVPTSSLLSPPIILSIVLHMLLLFGFQFGGTQILISLDWHFNTCELEGNTVYPCEDNSTIFLISNMQYLITALSLSMDKPFRQPFYYNKGLMCYLVVALFISFYMIIGPAGWTKSWVTLSDFEDDNWKYYLLLITIVNFILDYSLEKFLIPVFERCYLNRQVNQIKNNIIKHPKETFKLNLYQKVENHERVIKEEKEGKKE